MNSDHQRILREVAEVHGQHDLDKLVTYFSKDVTYEDVPLGITARGHEEMKDLFRQLYTSLPDYRMKLVSMVVDDERGAVEFVQVGTNMGDAFGYKASGKPVEIRTAGAMRFSNGLITHWQDYWSELDFKMQIGVA